MRNGSFLCDGCPCRALAVRPLPGRALTGSQRKEDMDDPDQLGHTSPESVTAQTGLAGRRTAAGVIDRRVTPGHVASLMA